MIRPQPQEISLSSQSKMFTRCLVFPEFITNSNLLRMVKKQECRASPSGRRRMMTICPGDETSLRPWVKLCPGDEPSVRPWVKLFLWTLSCAVTLWEKRLYWGKKEKAVINVYWVLFSNWIKCICFFSAALNLLAKASFSATPLSWPESGVDRDLTAFIWPPMSWAHERPAPTISLPWPEIKLMACDLRGVTVHWSLPDFCMPANFWPLCILIWRMHFANENLTKSKKKKRWKHWTHKIARGDHRDPV